MHVCWRDLLGLNSHVTLGDCLTQFMRGERRGGGLHGRITDQVSLLYSRNAFSGLIPNCFTLGVSRGKHEDRLVIEVKARLHAVEHQLLLVFIYHVRIGSWGFLSMVSSMLVSVWLISHWWGLNGPSHHLYLHWTSIPTRICYTMVAVFSTVSLVNAYFSVNK